MEYLPLSEISVINMGQSPESSSYNEDGNGIPFFQGNADFGEKYPSVRIWCDKPTKIANRDDILISVRAPIGAMNYAPSKCCIGRGLAAITVSSNYISEYIYYLLKSKYDDLNKQGTGSTFKAINKKVLENVKVPYITIAEQKAIVDQLTIVQSLINYRKEQLILLDDLIKSRFVEMFGLPIKNTKHWKTEKAVNICNVITDGSHFSPEGKEKGYPMLSVKDMQRDGFTYSNCKFVDEETFNLLRRQGCVPQVNDVLVAKDGSYFTRAFEIKEFKQQAILSSIGLYRPDTSKILPGFLADYLMSGEVINFVNNGYVSGTALRRVIIKGLKEIPVYLPPIEIQEEYILFKQQVDKSRDAIQKSLDEAQLLFDSLMQEYFG